ncbi:hypothetical protein N7537_006551 [Penicillium hordei]|uniref:Uncharacterized protein n=1 Tax=Penicillium hordei TaxID=40994 RepID=A0AAD6H4I4_9EURO|nr:uncharacterized protein N7537_006551 [Penicillium hordei]KAJ5603595.1 hypothetical protein N7537_006551 [Penicillium hordei]
MENGGQWWVHSSSYRNEWWDCDKAHGWELFLVSMGLRLLDWDEPPQPRTTQCARTRGELGLDPLC